MIVTEYCVKETVVDGYEISIVTPGSGNSSIRVKMPDGKVVHCLKRGTHVALEALPLKIRHIAETLAQWS